MLSNQIAFIMHVCHVYENEHDILCMVLLFLASTCKFGDKYYDCECECECVWCFDSIDVDVKFALLTDIVFHQWRVSRKLTLVIVRGVILT